jgi:hypothetical protein
VDVTEWEPATDAEVAMRDALRTDDQESYFRILAGVDLLLPVSADALAGLAPLGWGTWSTGGRTHVLAFTSPSALQACLADYTGSARRVPYKELAETWPNLEWWLAVNPGLPIEGYLPAWFVAQLARGDLRMPTRGPGRDAGSTTPHPEDVSAASDSPQQRDLAGASMSPAGGPSAPVGPGGLPIRSPGAVRPSGLPSRVPAGAQPAAVSAQDSPGAGAVANRGAAAGSALREGGARPGSSEVPSGPGSSEAGGPLPRRQVTTPESERPPSMAAAAQAFSGMRTAPPPSAPATPTSPAQPGIVPPVIPGSEGAERAPAGPLPTRTPGGTAAEPAPPPAEDVTATPGDESAKDDDFVPANDVERELYEAADGGSTDRFLSTLLLSTVLVPVAHNSRPGSAPGESGFAFRTEEVDGERYLVVFTSRDRLSEHFAEPTRTAGVRFYELIRNWPDPAWSFAVNPGSPVGAKYPGPQVIALASWAAEAGLGDDPAETDERAAPMPVPQKVNDAAQHATVMQKTVPPAQVDFYTDRGYDRVAGFVHRANEVEHLRTPAELFGALGLVHEGSPFQPDAKEAHVLRWPAYRPSLYRIPYGGQSEQALRAMDGWVIERPPFRGNGFAPGEGRDVIAEFKVDSVRLPHGAQLWRMDADGAERMVAIFDADAPMWRRVGEQ